MNNRKVTADMISQMSKQSIKGSSMGNIFVMVTIILASALLTAVLMFAAGQKQQEKNACSHRQQVTYYHLTEAQAEQLGKDHRIAYQIQGKTGILSEQDGFDVMPYYISQLSDEIQIGELEQGKLPETENEVAVQDVMLKKMNVPLALGSSVTFSFYDGNRETFTVSGILKGSDGTKQFPLFFSESYGKNGSQLKDAPYEVYAKLHGAKTMSPEACKEVMYLIGKDAGIEREYVNPSKSFLDSLSFDMQSAMLYGLVGMVILLAGILVIYGVFYLSVVGKIRQFGQLRTIGMTKKQIRKFVSRQGGILFLRSAPIGVGIGGIAGYFMIPNGFSGGNTFWILVLVFGIVYAVTMISVRKPARLASAVSPIEALRYLPQESMKRKTNKKICRNLTPFGLGIMNFSRNRKKTVITMISLALGGILFMTAAVYLSSFDKENYARQGYFKKAEFNLQYADGAIELNENGMSGLQAETPLGEELIQEISLLDGVKNVSEVKGFGVKFDYPQRDLYETEDVVSPLTKKEAEDLDRYLEEGSCDYEKLVSGDYILVADNEVVEEIYGWKFKVGDDITLHYYDGKKTTEKKVTILGVLNQQYVLDHSGSLEGWFCMPEEAVLKMVCFESINNHLLIAAEPDKEEEVEKALTQIIADKPELAMETLAERKTAYQQTADQIFGAISGLSIFIMMFSILSMMNTLITNIVTRKQELAVLASIGMSREQTRKMLLWESLFLVLVTLGVTMTIGTACGYLLSHTLYERGAAYMVFRFPVVPSLVYLFLLIAVPLMITFTALHNFSKEALVERLRGIE
ncbi:MAG: ABC transporter permease [Lachnospiraceae bacterium]|nr:ABC transporter permease [Lachnospiraceae bacterium]